MAGSGRWTLLELPQSRAPKLLLKASVTTSGYHVQLTDLCRMWSETLNKREVIRRAWDDGCSIDPSEDDEQYNIFLSKIEAALAGNDGTTREIRPNGGDGLFVKLSASLPKPIPTLVWTLSLARQPDEALANVLTVPLLQRADELQLQVQQLVQDLHDKDRVISKITDRLETSGNDLTTVFPGVSNIKTSKKKSQREQLARHVKGLAEFDEAVWRSQIAGRKANGFWDRIRGVVCELPEAEGMGGDQLLRMEWWLGLQGGSTAKPAQTPSPEAATPSPAAADRARITGDESMGVDEFQRLGTPDHLRHKTPANSREPQSAVSVSDETSVANAGVETAQNDDGDSTTEDEDDLDAIPKSSLVSDSRKGSSPHLPNQPPAGPSKKLGALGGRSARSPSLAARESTPKEQPQAVKPHSKLGAIGGKAKTPQSSFDTPAGLDADPTSPPPPRKMGIIGGKRKPSTSVPASAMPPNASPQPERSRERSRAPTKEPMPPSRETSQERADRKRDQLKKELEQKTKAPAKKKRKF